MSGKRLSTRNLKDDSGSLRSVHSAPKQSHFTVPANFGREATSAPASQQLQRASKTFEQFSKNIPLSVKRGSVLLKEFEYTNFSKIPASSQDKARTCPDQRGTAHDLAHKPSVLPTQTKHIEDTSNNADISQQFRSASSPAEVQESSTHSLTVVMHPKDCLENEQQNKDTEKGNINSHPSAEETHKPVTDGSKATDNLSLVQSDLIRGLTLKEYEIKEQVSYLLYLSIAR